MFLYLLQLSDLPVERVHVLLDDVRQLLDLRRTIVEDRFPLGQQRQLLQLSVGVGDVAADAASDLHELGRLTSELAVIAASGWNRGTERAEDNLLVYVLFVYSDQVHNTILRKLHV